MIEVRRMALKNYLTAFIGGFEALAAVKCVLLTTAAFNNGSEFLFVIISQHQQQADTAIRPPDLLLMLPVAK